MAHTKQTAKKTTGAIGQCADIPPPTNTFQAGSGQTGTPLQTHTTTSANNDIDGFIAFTFEDLGKDNPGFYTKAFEPIEGAVINVSCTTLTFFPKLNTAETLLLLIAVRGAECMDEPAMATYQLLHQFLGMAKATCIMPLSSMIWRTLLAVEGTSLILPRQLHLSKGNCTCQVVVFFVTHTTPDGDLHFSGPRPANRSKGATMLPGHSHTPATMSPLHVLRILNPNKFSQVLNRIFTKQFLSALQWIPDTSLFLLICGGYCGHTETMEWVNSVVQRQFFHEVISFTNKRFQPCWASSFCAKYVQSFYLEDVKYPIAMEQILAGNARLGIVSDIVIISHDKDSLPGVRRDLYYWAQEKHSPYGFRIPSQCPTCLRLGTITSSMPSDFHGTKLRIYCTHRTNGKHCTFEQLELIKEGRSKGSELLHGWWFTEIF
ncbi:hypothetical protein PC9H_001689 [Pleurotus ostreatus]|uniref:Uncharacterized protein n=1 Tax=Pleurotus ostreatus TaxID=5322 RepID=A0A8H7A3C8_PLEOS|nr:uncharacterized protein PC9H_001689 [Pleurotus ostreatus]KAF7441340.1 hypothetical protein PC9H_001689 [Pleurotus ostreatus]